MKRLILATCIILFFFSASAQYKFAIKVKTNLPERSKVIFCLSEDKGLMPLKRDSAYVKDGSVSFSGEMDQPSRRAELSDASHIGAVIRLGLDTGVHAFNMTLVSGKRDRFNISGLNTRSISIDTALLAIWNKAIKDGPLNNDFTRYMKVLTDQIELLKSYPNDFYSVVVLYQLTYGDSSYEYSKKILDTWSVLSPELQNSRLGKKIYEERTDHMNALVAAGVGKPVSDFSVKDLSGATFKNSALSGKPYLIVFSATWCEPCQKQLPKLKTMYTKYKAKGLKVIYFNLDDDVKRWQKHVATNKLTWINVSERKEMSDSKIQRSFGVWSVPTCILVDKSGTIVYNSDQQDTGLAVLEPAIKKTLIN